MSNGLKTINTHVEVPEADITTPDLWSKSYNKRPEAAWKIVPSGQNIEMVLPSVTFSATAIPDYRLVVRRVRATTTVVLNIEGVKRVIGRPIMRVDALRIARQIIERAEQERTQLAEWEAMRGIQWEESE